MKRGEIYLADLDPTRGTEQAGRRPVLVFQHHLVNGRGRARGGFHAGNAGRTIDATYLLADTLLSKALAWRKAGYPGVIVDEMF